MHNLHLPILHTGSCLCYLFDESDLFLTNCSENVTAETARNETLVWLAESQEVFGRIYQGTVSQLPDLLKSPSFLSVFNLRHHATVRVKLIPSL
jgi:hypothetical protein